MKGLYIQIETINEIALSIARHSGFISSSDYNVCKGFLGLFRSFEVSVGKCKGGSNKAEYGWNNMSTHDIQK